MVDVDAAAAASWEWSASVAVGDRQARNGNGNARRYVERAASAVTVDGKEPRPGADDAHAVSDEQVAAGQRDCAGDRRGVNRVTVSSVAERVAQRTGAAIICVADGNGRCSSVELQQTQYNAPRDKRTRRQHRSWRR